MITLRTNVGCGYVQVSWRTVNTEICTIHLSDIVLRSRDSDYSSSFVSSLNHRRITGVPSDERLIVSIFVSPTNSISLGRSRVPAYSKSVRTELMESMYVYSYIATYVHIK